MLFSRIRRRAALAPLLAASLPGQLPLHAVRIDPTVRLQSAGFARDGSARHPITVPAAPWCIGLRVLSECRVLDFGVAASFSRSAQLESWIR